MSAGGRGTHPGAVRILFACDGSPQADVARALLVGLPWPVGTPVRVIAVIEPMPVDAELPAHAHDALLAALRRELEGPLAATTASLAEHGLAAETAVLLGRPSSVIVDEAKRFEAGLIVVGSRGRGALASTFLGSVAAEVIDQAPCPVLVARRPALRRIVFAEDGSEPARVVAQALSEWPALGGVPVHVVSVLPLRLEAAEDPTARHVAADPAYAVAVDRAREACQRLAHQTAARLGAAGLDAHYAVRSGDPAVEILDAASEFDADLIAMGTRGRTGLERVLLGSVARNVLHRATCSVLVARRPVRP